MSRLAGPVRLRLGEATSPCEGHDKSTTHTLEYRKWSWAMMTLLAMVFSIIVRSPLQPKALQMQSMRSCVPYCAIDSQHEAIQMCRKWINEHVIRLNLCPFAAKPFVDDSIRYAVTDATTDEDLMAAFWREGQLLLETSEKELATTMLIAPSYKAGIEDFYWLYEWLVDTLEADDDPELGNAIQPAFFHPEWTFDGLPAGDAMHFEKRSPLVVINLLRRESLDRVVEEGLAAGRIVNKDIADHNAARLEREGYETMSAIFRKWLQPGRTEH